MSLYFPRLAVITMLALSLFSLNIACEKRADVPRDLLLAEGSGIKGLVHLGQPFSSLKKQLGRASARTQFEDFVVVRRYEYVRPPITVDTVDAGDGEVVNRISLDCAATVISGSQAKSPRMAPRDAFSCRTAKGLRLLPHPPTREAVVAIYGEPRRSYRSYEHRAVAQDILDGVPYSMHDERSDSEFLHYPGLGMEFSLHGTNVVKCSVQAPRAKPLRPE